MSEASASDRLLARVPTGLVGYPSDDINKFLWMVRIGGGVFPRIKEPDYLVSGWVGGWVCKFVEWSGVCG